MAGFQIPDMAAAISERLFPAITQLNRLEGRPRTRQFDQSLKAEVRDALWMLTRQWQMGEFEGDDAGSPFFAKMHLQSAPLTKYRARSQATEVFEDDIPLEPKVERRPIPLTQKNRAISLEIRVLMGRQWHKLISELPGLVQKFLEKYPIDPSAATDADCRAHPDVSQTFDALANRRIDGGKIYLHLIVDPTHRVYDGIVVDAADQPTLDARAKKFVAWYERLFYQPKPETNTAWDSSRLEYQCACSAPTTAGEKVFVAEEYYQGHFDWYNFNIDDNSPGLGNVPDPLPKAITRTVIPTPVQFDNMPNTRWWEFEDRKTNYGNVTAATTDLARLLFLEFGLVYANDWFLIPCTLPSGSISNVLGLVVTNVFGEHIWIDPAGSGLDDNWQRWSMFTLNSVGSVDANVDHTLLVLPTLPTYQESKPLEEIILLRDESANMVWGIEKTVHLPDGSSRPGYEMATETHAFLNRTLAPGLAPAAPVEYHAKIYYRVMNTVPENWIPFIPTHMPGSIREIQLQRAVMPRIFDAEVDPAKVALLANEDRLAFPQTMLLREGLDMEPKQSYFVHEEEVPRSGVRLTLTFQRARWKHGKVVTWLGLSKEVGRGEGSSALKFDQIVAVSAKN
jgi:hypothetical protein